MRKNLRKGKNIQKELIKKAQNRQSIRVLYKKIGQPPKVKILPDAFHFKKAIIEKSLDIIPYEDHFIVCQSKEKRKQMKPHIILDYNHIAGDLIVVNIDKQKREFQSLSQEDILWFTQDLMKKIYDSPLSLEEHPIIQEKKKTNRTVTQSSSIISNEPKTIQFERSLINVLINIELLLANLSKNKTEGENEDEP